MKQNNLGSQQVEKSVNSVSGKVFTSKKLLYRLRQIYIQEYKHFFPLDYLKTNFLKYISDD